MHRPKMKDVHPLGESDSIPTVDPNSERKLVLLCQTETEAETELDADTRCASVYQDPILQKFLSDESSSAPSTIRRSTHDVTLGYDHYTVDQVLAQLLPPSVTSTPNGTDIPSSFEAVGHLAHLNLRAELRPYKLLIGRVILDKNTSLKVVVNKVGTIQNEFRTFPMEILAVEEDLRSAGGTTDPSWKEGERCETMEVSMKEDGCVFVMDFAKVYWNSRLQFEHRRLVTLLAGTSAVRVKTVGKRGRGTPPQVRTPDAAAGTEIVVADACAGIGPFAIPLTSQFEDVIVHANDLNPVSHKYLAMNGVKNRCPESRLKLYNMDARLFLRTLDAEGIRYHHVLMNLPAIAPEFLHVFRGWTGDYAQRPMVHVHCFGGKDDAASDDALARCARALGCPLDKEVDEASVHIVRDVSPKKNMLCVSFRLPLGVKNVERIHQFGAVQQDDDDTIVDEVQNEGMTTITRRKELPGDEVIESLSPIAKKARSN